MNNQIQLVLKSSTNELSLNDRELGIYLTPELDGLTGLPEIRTTSGVNAGYDGGWTSAQNYDARSITIRGVIANENVATVEQLRRQLTTLAGQGKNEELTLDLVTQGGKAYTIQVRTIALEMALQKVLCQQEFMLQLRADDPLIYDGGSSGESVIVQVQKAIGGFQINFELPLAISGGSGESTINNGGLEQVYPIIKMYGALHNPTFVNQTTNQQFEVNATLGFAEGAWHTPSELYEGTTINIQDAPDNAPLASFQLKGETSQQTYTGKNLINTHATPVSDTLASGGISYTIAADGSIATSGTSTAGYKNIRFDITLPAGTYRATGCPSDGSVNTYSFDVQVGSTQYYDTGSGVTFTLSAETTISAYAIRLGGNTGINMNNKVFKPMITVSTASEDYEPYVGGTPAPNPDYPQAVQTVTGENVVKICGKNLFNKNNSGILDDVRVSTSNGKTYGSVGSHVSYFIKVKPSTNYTLTTGRNAYYSWYSAPSEDSYISGSGWQDRYYFKSPANAQYIRFDFTDGNIVQFVEGTSVGAYEPYQGQSYEIDLASKNLFDVSKAQDYKWLSAGTGWVIDSSDPNIVSDYIHVEIGKTYVISGIGELQWNLFSFQYPGAYGTREIANSATIRTYTATTEWLRFSIGGGNAIAIKGDIQLEKGSTATSYAAYFEPIELCKIGDYQDYIYKSGGKWYVHKEVKKSVFDQNSGWTKNQYGTNAYNVKTEDIFTAVAEIGVISPQFIAKSYNGRTDAVNNIIFADSNDGMAIAQRGISIRNTSWSDLTSFTTWITSNPITAYYVLATPTDTEITNEALVAQLEAVLGGHTYAGVNNIFTATPNEQGTLEISFMTEKDADKRDVMVIDSRMRTVTLNGADIYHLITAGSEFPMLAPGENKLLLRSDTPGDNGYADVNYKQGYLTI